MFRHIARTMVRFANASLLKPLGIELLRSSYVAYLENRKRHQETPVAIEGYCAAHIDGLSETTNPRRYDDQEWLELHYHLETYSYDEHVFHKGDCHVYRKGWEWTHCLYGLEKLGVVTPAARALGVGAGREPVIFYLADRIASVTATDLYGDDAWSDNVGKEASAQILENAQAFCKRPIPHDRLHFEVADGTNLPYEDASFEIVWSLSSIEHFGGHDQAAKAIREMARVTAPNGVVALATEYLLLEEYLHAEYFTRSDVLSYLIEPARKAGLHLVDTPDFDAVPYNYLIDSVPVPQNVDRLRRHVVLNNGDVQWTSIILFFRKAVA